MTTKSNFKCPACLVVKPNAELGSAVQQIVNNTNTIWGPSKQYEIECTECLILYGLPFLTGTYVDEEEETKTEKTTTQPIEEDNRFESIAKDSVDEKEVK